MIEPSKAPIGEGAIKPIRYGPHDRRRDKRRESTPPGQLPPDDDKCVDAGMKPPIRILGVQQPERVDPPKTARRQPRAVPRDIAPIEPSLRSDSSVIGDLTRAEPAKPIIEHSDQARLQAPPRVAPPSTK